MAVSVSAGSSKSNAIALNVQVSLGEVSLKLLTFNTWGLKFVSKYRTERLRAIAEALATGDDYDIVALQEVWCEEDWFTIDRECALRYPYRRIFKSGIITGPGLAILSKLPITETFLYRFPINGQPWAVNRGDWLVGKSVAVTMLKPHHPQALPIAVLNSHMHAPYAQTGDAAYACHRACQAWDFAKLVKILKRAGYAVIQVGDLNSKPGSLPYKLFTVEGGLSDSWNNCDKNDILSIDQIADMSPYDQVKLGGVTCDSQLNTWRASRDIWEACRLDYALVDSNNVKIIDTKVKFTERLPAPYNCSYSDHFAYSAELVVNNREEHVRPPESQHITDKLAIYQELLAEIGEYRKVTITRQSRWRKWHFFISVIAVITLHIAVVFFSAVTPLSAVGLMFLSCFIGITGTLNGLMWYMGVRSELRALQEVEMEVEDVFRALKNE